jgi:hypothetical protein
MARLVRALLIDPYRGTVTEVDHDASDYRNIYAWLSGRGDPAKAGPETEHEVDTFQAFYAGGNLPEGDALFIDDEGMLKGPVAYFTFDGQPLAGRALVLGSDEQGETQACKLTFEECCKRVEMIEGRHDIEPPPPVIRTFKNFDELAAFMGGDTSKGEVV